MIIAFIGHSEIIEQQSVCNAVCEELKSACERADTVVCYVGAQGDFDEISLRACKRLKREKTGVEVVYVTPYITPTEQGRIREMQERKMIDSSVYPPLEGVPPRFAISKRNEWMMKNADLVIAYVRRGYGGAYKAMSFARRHGKTVINLAERI